MSTSTVIEKAQGLGDGRWVEFPDVGWKGYSTLLRLRGRRSFPKMVYVDGTVYLMSPGYPHERLKKRLGWIVEETAVVLRRPFIATGSTTFRRPSRKGGVEGDQSYYLANAARILGKDRIDLKMDPPPDLAIEAVDTHAAEPSIKVYRRLRVPELWICDESEMVILVLQPDGQYTPSATSLAFSSLTAAEIHDWATRPQMSSDADWLHDWRRWVRRTLRRRTRAAQGPSPGE